jgi:hypothetical protein
MDSRMIIRLEIRKDCSKTAKLQNRGDGEGSWVKARKWWSINEAERREFLSA